MAYATHQNYQKRQCDCENIFSKRKLCSKMIFKLHVPLSKFPFLECGSHQNFLFWKFFPKMIFKPHMLAIKFSFFGMWVPSEFPFLVILMAYNN